jgi:hypothetical protein
MRLCPVRCIRSHHFSELRIDEEGDTTYSYGWRDNPDTSDPDDPKRGSATYDRGWSSRNWHDGHARARDLCGGKDVDVHLYYVTTWF